LFRALVEATAYGAKAIVDRFQETGVEIKEVIAQGGIPGKNEFVMQVSADVLGMPIKVVQSDQAVALGAAMFAAVAAGKFKDVFAAQDAMLSGYSKVYEPDPESSKRYQGLYEKYLSIGELLADTLRAL
jgi:L-ribulokinase